MDSSPSLYKSKLLQVLRSFLDEGDQPEPIRPFKLSNVDYSGKRILLVEDNELNREIAVEIIGSTGYHYRYGDKWARRRT